MSAYIARLQQAVKRDQEDARARQNSEAETARDRMTPLQDRLARLLQTIPLELQREGLSLPALQASLRGRWRGACHPGELGSALRRAGFERRRKWSDEEGFRAIWCLRQS